MLNELLGSMLESGVQVSSWFQFFLFSNLKPALNISKQNVRFPVALLELRLHNRWRASGENARKHSNVDCRSGSCRLQCTSQSRASAGGSRRPQRRRSFVNGAELGVGEVEFGSCGATLLAMLGAFTLNSALALFEGGGCSANSCTL